MEIQEAKESEEGSVSKKGGKIKGPGAKKLMLAAETLPSPKGRRIEPVIDPELRKKIEKAVQQKENKGKRVSNLLMFLILMFVVGGESIKLV
jgi:hypothetical protein